MKNDYQRGWVSVIIPTYNRANLLLETLQSVANQQYRPIEVLIVDDGSTDATPAIVGQFTKKHQHADFSVHFLSQTNQGASVARSLGLEHSTGEYIQFLDSDDLLHPEKISRQIDRIVSRDLDLVWSPAIRFNTFPNWSDAAYIGLNQASYTPEALILGFINKSLWRTESCVYRRAICQRTGPWETLAMFQDWEYHLRMLAQQPKAGFVDGIGSAARHHDQGRIGDGWASGSGLDGALQAIKLAEQSTATVCKDNALWIRAIRTRYQEVLTQANHCNRPLVAEQSLGYLNALG